jgi:two-component system response regulator YesN
MYQVLIVDDERLIREGLRGLIDWESMGYTVAAVASDGVEALAVLGAQPIDLVVADIRMPRMDGLEFLETLRRRGDPVRFLILSGFAEFEYAQRASGLNVDGYLLKPVDEAELIRRLHEVRQRLDARFTALNLVEGTVPVPPAYAWGRWQLVYVAPLSSAGLPLALDPEAQQRFERTLTDQGWGEAFFQPPLAGVVLRKVFPGGRNLGSLTRELTAALHPAATVFAAVIGEVETTPADLAASARLLRHLLADRFFFEPNTVHWLPRREPGRPVDSLESWSEKLALALEAGQTLALRSLVSAIADALAASGSEEAVKDGLARVATEALGARGRSTAWISDLWRQPFFSSLVAFVTHHLEAQTTDARGVDSTGLVDRIQEVMESRYAEPLKLESLAEIFHYNPAYLGKLYRSKTGEYFNTALDRVRVRKAQQLLHQGFKVYQVAEMVGYKYVDYFHAKFKKYTGVSPSRYRGGDAESAG